MATYGVAAACRARRRNMITATNHQLPVVNVDSQRYRFKHSCSNSILRETQAQGQMRASLAILMLSMKVLLA
jgi:hypothetical protein